jgi:hypothetical protein
MLDILEGVFNVFGGIFMGTLLLEYGACKLQTRSFSKNNLWPMFVIGLGIRFVLKKGFF